MKPMKFFKSEKNYVFKKMSREFNFTAFSGLILIRISINSYCTSVNWLVSLVIISDKDRSEYKFAKKLPYLYCQGGSVLKKCRPKNIKKMDKICEHRQCFEKYGYARYGYARYDTRDTTNSAYPVKGYG